MPSVAKEPSYVGTSACWPAANTSTVALGNTQPSTLSNPEPFSQPLSVAALSKLSLSM